MNLIREYDLYYLFDPRIFSLLSISYVLNTINSVKITNCCNIIPEVSKNFVRFYNVVQIVVCSYMTVGLFPVVSAGLSNPFGINMPYNDLTEWYLFIHYLSKYLDWVDTAIIISRRKTKQLSLLHVYHHSSVSMIWGFMLYMGHGNGTATFGAWINSLTHVIMYGHYLLTSFNIRNPFKRYITMWQITQFYLCVIHACTLLFIYPEWETYLPISYSWLQLTYHTTLITLFTSYMDYVPKILTINPNPKTF